MTEDLRLDPNITLEEMTAKAEDGHKVAQYVLSKYHGNQGAAKESLDWMSKSADNEFPPAQVEMGMWHLLGHIVDRNHDKALIYFQKGVDANFSFALRIMAVLHALGFAVEKNWEKAIDFLLQAADQEDFFCLRQIGFLCLKDKTLKPLGEVMIKRAASLDDPVSLALLNKKPGEVKSKEIPAKWDKWPAIRKFLVSLDEAGTFSGKDLSAEPSVKQFENVFTHEECLYLREAARPSLTEDIQLLGGNPDDPSFQKLQTNRAMVFFPIVQDLVTISLAKRLARVAEVPFEQAELPIVHHYAEGQEFKPHTDYMNPELPQHAFSIQESGQRIKSVFAYLNDDYEGGETAFYKTGLKVKGKEGDVIVLENVNSIGLPDENSEHAGLPVTKGEKWLATLWLRDKVQS